VAINLKKSSLQRIFEYGVKAIRKQAAPGAARAGFGCDYLTDDGKKCIAGHMLTDEQLSSIKARGLGSIGYNDEAKAFFKELIGADRSGKKLELLQRLQEQHDGANGNATSDEDFLDKFEDSMARVAEPFGLKYTPPGVVMRT
jgi:hypothetical protein